MNKWEDGAREVYRRDRGCVVVERLALSRVAGHCLKGSRTDGANKLNTWHPKRMPCIESIYSRCMPSFVVAVTAAVAPCRRPTARCFKHEPAAMAGTRRRSCRSRGRRRCSVPPPRSAGELNCSRLQCHCCFGVDAAHRLFLRLLLRLRLFAAGPLSAVAASPPLADRRPSTAGDDASPRVATACAAHCCQ